MIASGSATLCGVASLFISLGIAAQERPTYQVGPQVDGSYVTPANQIVTPAGTQVHFNGRPMVVAVRPDQKTAAVLVAGGGYNLPTLPIAIVDLTAGTVKQEFNPGTNNGSYDGLIYSPDGTHLYFSQDTGQVVVANVAADGTLALNTIIHLPAPTGPTPVGSVGGTVNNGGLALSGDGKFLYVVENMVNDVAVIDLSTNQISTVIPVENAPASIVVVGKSAYVTNQGGRPAKPGEYTDLSAGTPIVADPEAAFSLTGTVSVIDLKENVVTNYIHVGLQPRAILAANGYVYVANTNSDSISVIDPSRNQVVETSRIRVFEDAPLGSFPNGLAFTSRGELAVSLGGNNAVALYRTKGGRKLEFEGFIPTAWYPAALAVVPASSSLGAGEKVGERLLIGNAKGTAVGSEVPDTSNPPGKNTHTFVGSLSLVALPEADDFRKYDAQVVANNGWKRHEESGRSSPFRADEHPIRHRE